MVGILTLSQGTFYAWYKLNMIKAITFQFNLQDRMSRWVIKQAKHSSLYCNLVEYLIFQFFTNLLKNSVQYNLPTLWEHGLGAALHFAFLVIQHQGTAFFVTITADVPLLLYLIYIKRFWQIVHVLPQGKIQISRFYLQEYTILFVVCYTTIQYCFIASLWSFCNTADITISNLHI